MAENSQIRDYFPPATLTMAFSNTLSATKTRFASQTGSRSAQNQSQQFTPKPFLGKPRPSKLAAGKDGTTNPDQTCQYCKDTGHLLEIVSGLRPEMNFWLNVKEKRRRVLN